MPWLTCNECGGLGTTRHGGVRAVCRSCAGGGWVSVRQPEAGGGVPLDGREQNVGRGRKYNADDRDWMETMNTKSGEIAIACALVLLAGSVLVSYFGAANDAQLMANQTGRDVSPWEMVDSSDVIQAGVSALGGYVAGWTIEQIKGDDKKDKPKPPPIQATSGRDNVIILGGDGTSGSNYQSQPTTTTHPTSPATTPEAAP